MRKFNKGAYNAYDKKAKLMIINIMEATGKYKSLDNIEEELYKECDVRMTHIDTGRVVRFENECRVNFDKIVQEYDTIHIPIRKKNTMTDFYFVWNTEITQFILIKREVFRKYRNTIINVECKEESNATENYEEEFIDIPKNECDWYVVGKAYKLHGMNWID